MLERIPSQVDIIDESEMMEQLKVENEDTQQILEYSKLNDVFADEENYANNQKLVARVYEMESIRMLQDREIYQLKALLATNEKDKTTEMQNQQESLNKLQQQVQQQAQRLKTQEKYLTNYASMAQEDHRTLLELFSNNNTCNTKLLNNFDGPTNPVNTKPMMNVVKDKNHSLMGNHTEGAHRVDVAQNKLYNELINCPTVDCTESNSLLVEKSKIEQLRMQLEDYRCTLIWQQVKLDELQSSSKEAHTIDTQDTLTQLQQQYEALQNQHAINMEGHLMSCQDWEALKLQFVNKIQNQDSIISSLKSEKEKIHAELTGARHELKKLTQQCKDLLTEKVAREKELNQWQVELEKLKLQPPAHANTSHELGVAQAALQHAKEKMDESQEELQHANFKLRQAENTIDNIKTSDKEHEGIKDKLKGAQNLLSEYQVQIIAEKSAYENTRAELKCAHQALDENRIALEESQSVLKQREQKLKDTEVALVLNQSELKGAQVALEKNQVELKHTQSMLKEAQDGITNYAMQIKDMEDQRHAAHTKNKELLEAMEMDLMSSTAQSDELIAQVKHQVGLYSTLESESKREHSILKSTITQYQEDAEAWVSLKASMGAQIVDIQLQNANLQTEASTLQARVLELGESNEELASRSFAMESEIDECKTSIVKEKALVVQHVDRIETLEQHLRQHHLLIGDKLVSTTSEASTQKENEPPVSTPPVQVSYKLDNRVRVLPSLSKPSSREENERLLLKRMERQQLRKL